MMTKETYMPFEEFYNSSTEQNISKRSKEDIIKEANEIRKKLGREVG